jgi:uncharacterized protein YigE (DUF2233 family)
MKRVTLLVLLNAFAVSVSGQKTDGLHCSTARVGSARFRTCELSVADIGRLSLASADTLGRPIGTIARLDSLLRTRSRRLAFAMNAGIYERAGVTTGLLVVDGEVKALLDTSKGPIGGCERSNFHCPPNGVFFVTAAGAAHVWTTAQFAHKYGAGRSATRVRLATQSGPMLLRDGRLARAFNPKSKSHLVRNGVCVRADGSIVFALADNVTHFEFATALRDRYRCRDALFLDGNVSRMYTGDDRPPAGDAFGALLFVPRD